VGVCVWVCMCGVCVCVYGCVCVVCVCVCVCVCTERNFTPEHITKLCIDCYEYTSQMSIIKESGILSIRQSTSYIVTFLDTNGVINSYV